MGFRFSCEAIRSGCGAVDSRARSARELTSWCQKARSSALESYCLTKRPPTSRSSTNHDPHFVTLVRDALVERERDGLILSTDRSRVEVDLVLELLIHSHWGGGMTRERLV